MKHTQESERSALEQAAIALGLADGVPDPNPGVVVLLPPISLSTGSLLALGAALGFALFFCGFGRPNQVVDRHVHAHPGPWAPSHPGEHATQSMSELRACPGTPRTACRGFPAGT